MMKATSFAIAFLLTAGMALLCSCNATHHNKQGVEAAMKYYDHLILQLDADSIALLFTPDGKLGDMATGRDSIKAFLSSFKNVKVLSQSSTTTSITITHDTALQKGIYSQSDLVAGKDTIRVKGTFIATWQWIKPEGWHIRRMTTSSAN